MNKIFLIWMLALPVGLWAQSPRNLLAGNTTAGQVAEKLVKGKTWVPFPAYGQRDQWSAIDDRYKQQLLTEGEKALSYQWKVVPASAYLELVRSGNRNIMQDPYGQNVGALKKLVLAELAEGKGRFINKMIDGVWLLCEMTSWSLSAHLNAQKAGIGLPDIKEPIIDLGVGNTANVLAWTHYFFRDAFDKVNPLVSERIRHEIRRQVLQPYYDRNDFWWMAFDRPDAMVNNWNVWVNYNVLTCILLVEEDPGLRTAGIYKSMRSVDRFINYYKEDGGCEEGPAYWSHAGGMLYKYLHLLHQATAGGVDYFDVPLVKRIGNYICKAYIDGDYYLNYADAGARLKIDPGTVFHFGQAVKDSSMIRFGAYLAKQQGWDRAVTVETIAEGLYNLFSASEILSVQPAQPFAASAWLEGTGIAMARDQAGTSKGFYFSALAGHNGESHNHNDVGTCVLYYNGQPVLVDIGSETYTRQTFGPERYGIWTMRSAYHNVPLINGVEQKAGKQFAARDVSYSEKGGLVRFSLDIAGAYPEAASVTSWKRSYELQRERAFRIRDQYNLQVNNGNNALYFMTSCKVEKIRDGLLLLKGNGVAMEMHYDTKALEPAIESISVTDQRLLQSWPPEMARIVFRIRAKGNTGDLTIRLQPVKQ